MAGPAGRKGKGKLGKKLGTKLGKKLGKKPDRALDTLALNVRVADRLKRLAVDLEGFIPLVSKRDAKRIGLLVEDLRARAELVRACVGGSCEF